MKFLILLFFISFKSYSDTCWRKVVSREHTQVFTVNLFNPSIETDSRLLEIYLSCTVYNKVHINDEIQLDEKTFKFNKLPAHGVMMKKTYTILKKL